MTPMDAESLPEADCKSREGEGEREGHAYANSFP